jgi:hypothetical protein
LTVDDGRAARRLELEAVEDWLEEPEFVCLTGVSCSSVALSRRAFAFFPVLYFPNLHARLGPASSLALWFEGSLVFDDTVGDFLLFFTF